LFVLMLRRLRMSLKAQREQALDVKQAQEVQHVILPETQAVFGGFTVESEYRPAREVGGDFFQVIEHPADGSLLIVTGDVAGKGLQAGMLVALLVGAIRATAAYDFEPLAMLNSLNHRLLGRGSAAATCLVLRVCEDGTATLANAGHVPPYLNGEPVAMEGALPLGISEYAEFSVMQFRLESGDKLVMVSDGVLEARDGSGALLGFERLRAMLMEPMSVTGLADAAQRFGQEDDISVLAVTRMA
jgi:serine phosphatase RsbU (regulator of sigma subunit)